MGDIPAAPPFRGLLLASLSDVMGMGIVATAGFRYSPLFTWERPYHEDFPDDTILSYRTTVKAAIDDSNCIVLVIEDKYNPDENESTSAVIPEDSGWIPPETGECAVAGVAVFILEPESKRRGQFQNNTECPNLPVNRNRDLNLRHYREWIKLEQDTLNRCFPSYSEMDLVVVHPAYWRKGNGTTLVNWGQALSTVDKVPQAVSAAEMGEKLYLKLGYEFVCRISMPGDNEGPEGVSTGLLVYKPN